MGSWGKRGPWQRTLERAVGTSGPLSFFVSQKPWGEQPFSTMDLFFIIMFCSGWLKSNRDKQPSAESSETWNLEPKETFPPCTLSQIFCHDNTKLMNTIMGIETCLLWCLISQFFFFRFHSRSLLRFQVVCGPWTSLIKSLIHSANINQAAASHMAMFRCSSGGIICDSNKALPSLQASKVLPAQNSCREEFSKYSRFCSQWG